MTQGRVRKQIYNFFFFTFYDSHSFKFETIHQIKFKKKIKRVNNTLLLYVCRNVGNTKIVTR